MKLSTRGKIARVYKKLFFHFFKKKSIKVFEKKLEEKPILDYIYTSITNEKSFDMLKASLISLYYTNEYLPAEVVIVSDGSFNLQKGEEYFSFWPNKIRVISWESINQELLNKDRKELTNWAEKQIWGKKMAAILYFAEEKATLFADPDVLWFQPTVNKAELSSEFFLKTTIDNSINYDQALLSHLNLTKINEAPPINCGVVWLKGNFFSHSQYLEKAIKYEAQQPGPFSEQTIFGVLISEFGSLYNLAEIESKITDSFWPIIPDYNKYPGNRIARHYLWALKWMFWRDFYYCFKSN